MYSSIDLPLSVVCPWIRGSFSLSDTTLVVRLANTVFGCIPAGREEQTIPLKSISGCVLDRHYDVRSIVMGIVMLMIGLANMFTPDFIPAGVFITIFGSVMVLGSIRTFVRIQNNGTETSVFVPFYGAKKAENAVRMINAAIDFS